MRLIPTATRITEGSRRHPLRAVILVAAAAALLGAGIPAVAAATAADPVTFYACVTQSGALKIVSASAICAPNEQKISWNSVGPAGPPGPQGPGGVTTVYQDNTALSTTLSSGFVTVATLQLPPGNYQVSASVSIGLNIPPETAAVGCGLADNNGGFIDFQDTTISTNTSGSVFTADGELTLLGDTIFGGTMQLQCAATSSNPANAAVQHATIQAIPVTNIVFSTG